MEAIETLISYYRLPEVSVTVTRTATQVRIREIVVKFKHRDDDISCIKSHLAHLKLTFLPIIYRFYIFARLVTTTRHDEQEEEEHVETAKFSKYF